MNRPLIIAGPCVAESYEVLESVAKPMKELVTGLGGDFVFKASFDKANRTSVDSYRGPGMATCLKWFDRLRQEVGVPVLTDVHECVQVGPVAEVCDWLQIPAFLCRQTDLIVAAVETGRAVNVKKGQFMAPEGVLHIAKKIRAVAASKGREPRFALTERGVTFGYGNYVVDMRSFPVMAKAGGTVVFDITHSLQRPGGGGRSGEVSGGEREYAPVLTRAAAATGYVNGFFLEVHPSPKDAKSDASTVLSISQASALLRQIVPICVEAHSWKNGDGAFVDRD